MQMCQLSKRLGMMWKRSWSRFWNGFCSQATVAILMNECFWSTCTLCVDKLNGNCSVQGRGYRSLKVGVPTCETNGKQMCIQKYLNCDFHRQNWWHSSCQSVYKYDPASGCKAEKRRSWLTENCALSWRKPFLHHDVRSEPNYVAVQSSTFLQIFILLATSHARLCAIISRV
jgi:hypothetical protein